MSKLSKTIDHLLKKPKDFTWEEAVTLMEKCDFEIIKNSGSRRKFYHKEKNILVNIHKPHPNNELKNYQVRDIIRALKTSGHIKDTSHD